MYVMLDADRPSAGETPQPELVVAQERIRSLEGQVAFLQEQLLAERNRNAALVEELKVATPHERRRPRWRFWQGR